MSNPDPKDIENLIEMFNASDWDEMHLKTDDVEIFLSNDPAATGPAAVSAATTAPPAVEATAAPATSVAASAVTAAAVSTETVVPDGMIAVRAPNLGTFYRAPKPGAPPYAEVGQAVDVDTEVCLIEVMKLFTPVRAGTKGVVRDICIDDGQMVEFDQVLIIIEPA